MQLTQTVCYGREYEEENKKQKKKKKNQAIDCNPSMAVRSPLKQPEKNAQRDPGEKGWTCYYCGKEGHLKQDYRQTSKLPPNSRSRLQRPEENTGEVTAL